MTNGMNFVQDIGKKRRKFKHCAHNFFFASSAFFVFHHEVFSFNRLFLATDVINMKIG